MTRYLVSHEIPRDDSFGLLNILTAQMAHRTTFTIFHALKPPAISVHKYLMRIFQYANCSRSCFVVALIYIDRIIQRNASFMITSLNIHRLLITRSIRSCRARVVAEILLNFCYSVMVSAKFFDDIYYDNAYYAKVHSSEIFCYLATPLTKTFSWSLHCALRTAHCALREKVGGIPTAEMNSLELEFLFMINFTLNVTPEVYRCAQS